MENWNALQNLTTGPSKVFEAHDSVRVDPDIPASSASKVREILARNKFFEQCQSAKRLELKPGAQVMLLQVNMV
jgi:hypothetical protein